MARELSDKQGKVVGQTIKLLRQQRLWTQAELARRLDTTAISIGRWEKNVTHPSLHFQQKLCEIFEKTPEELGFVPEAEHLPLPERESNVAASDQHTDAEPQVASSNRFSPLPEGVSAFLDVSSRRPRLRPFSPFFLVILIGLAILVVVSGIFLSLRSAQAPALLQSACQAAATGQTPAEIYQHATCATPALSSALTAPDSAQWDQNEHCMFTNGAYHVILPDTAYVVECFARTKPLSSSFALQVDMKVLQGYSGGLLFRAENPSNNWDVVTSRIPIDIWGQYNFYLASANVPCNLTRADNDPYYCHSPHGTITYGVGMTNTITIVALGTSVYLYVNGLFIDRAVVAGSASLTGFVGVFAAGSQTVADVAFNHFKMWNI